MPLKEETLKQYKNEYFVETGSYLGEGIGQAISAGFSHIISLELSLKYFDFCTKKFSNNHNVNIIFGDSALILENCIKDINSTITFWLDGHYTCCPNVIMGKKYSPLMEELDVIATHPIKTHTIIIDDIREWEPLYGFRVDEIKNKIKLINENYVFITEDSDVAQQDILVAKI